MVLGYIEYLATLISPHPRETIKAIEARQKRAELEKIRSGEDIEKEYKLFHDDHRNTTFFDSIASEGGEQALQDLKRLFDDKPEENKSVELYSPKAEDIDFIEKALQKKVGGDDSPTDQVQFDTIEF